MTALKKILLLMLVICTMGYGSAWAYDGHAVELGDVDVTDVMLGAAAHFGAAAHIDSHVDSHSANNSDNQSSEKSSTADILCDHCSHIAAHLQAIFTHNGFLCDVNRSSELLEFSETFVSYIVSPDLRPPRV
ncbi:hypothetical protein MNBD_GAMMA06-1892 [hydrothermal vent metagenome]|uniref:DUF2946 domain-containing protein n=1 Tax=hydrothermal vent metagenome TaxID=652676 RepID=A0A3B0X3R3_9ZZZZ